MRSPKIQNLQGSRRLRPLRSYFKRPKSSPVRPLACNRYYCVQFTAKPKAACALRFSWAATSSNLSLGANMTSFMKPEVHNVSIRRQTRTELRSRVACTKIGEDRTCSSEDMIVDRQTLGALGLHRRYDGSLLVIDESVHVCRVQFWSCRSGSSCCTARHQGC